MATAGDALGLTSLYPSLTPSRGMVAPQQPAVASQPQPTGTGNLVTSALGSGVYGGLADLGQAAQAGATLFGATDAAKAAADFAARQRATAATYATPENENASVFTPRGLAYRVLQGAPQIAAGLGGALVGGMVAPEAAAAGLIGAGASALPFAIGQNVNTYEGSHPGGLTQGAAAKAIALGLPEAAIGAFPAERAAGRLVSGVASQGFAHEATKQAVAQAAAGAGQSFIAQQMGDPNRTIYQRAQDMIDSALVGGVTGGLMGAGVHALAKTPPAQASTEAVAQAVDQQLAGAPRAQPLALPPPPVRAGPPLDTLPAQEILRRAQTGDTAAMQEMMRRAGQTVPGIEEAPAIMTPPEETPSSDTIRLYRGEGGTAASLQGQPAHEGSRMTGGWFTTDPEKAARYGDVSYVDVPRSDLNQFAQGHGGPDEFVTDNPKFRDAMKPLVEAPLATPDTIVQGPNRPDRSVIKQSMLQRFDVAEAMRDETQDPETIRMLDDIQTRMQSPKNGGAIKGIDRDLAVVRQQIDADRATADQAAARGESPPPVRAERPIEPTVAPAPVNQSEAVGDLQDAITTAKKSLMDMAKLKAPDTGSTVHDDHVQGEWYDGVKQQAMKLKMIDDAIKSGNTAALANLPENHFQNDDLWTNEKLSNQQQDALDKHADLEQNIMDAARRVAPRAAAASPSAEGAPPSTPHDQDIAQVVQNGGTLKDALQHMQQNGSSGLVKTMANVLLQHGADAPISFAPEDTSRSILNRREGERAEASYQPDTGKILLHQNSDLERLVLHEGVHAATSAAIDAGTPAGKQLQNIFEDAKSRYLGDWAPNGFRNAHEFTAEAFSNPKFREFLDNLPSKEGPATTVWRAIKNAVGKIFGFDGGAKQTILDRVMDAGQQAMVENASAPMSGGRVYSKFTPQEADARVKGYADKLAALAPIGSLEAAAEAAGNKMINLGQFARGVINGFTSPKDIARWWEPFSKGMTDYVSHADRSTLLNEVNNKIGSIANTSNRGLSKAESKAVGDLIMATHIGLNPAKDWGAVIRENPDLNTPELMQEHRKAAATYANPDNARAVAAYETMVATNQARIHQVYAQNLYKTMKDAYSDKIALPPDPVEEHHLDNTGIHDDAVKNRDFWAAKGAELSKLAQAHVDEQTGLASQKKDESLSEGVQELRSLLGDYAAADYRMRQVPNFHMGREGDHFVSGHLPKTEDGKVDPAAIAKVQKVLNDNGYGHIELNEHLGSNTFYARLETPGESEYLANILRGLDKDTISNVANGRADELVTTRGVMPLWREKMLGRMEAQFKGLGEDADDATKAQLAQRVADMKREFLNMLPDSSINKIMARRAGVQGFSGDWAKNFKQRDANTSRMMSKMATMSDIAAATGQMRKDVQTMNGRTDVTPGQRFGLSQAAQELMRREVNSPMNQPNSAIGTINSLSHTIELGMSVAYATMLQSQNFTLTLPRLGAEAGYMNAVKAMGAQTANSIALVKSALKGEGWRTASLRASELEKDGWSQKDNDFLMRQQALGTFNHGGYTNAMTGHHADAEGTLNFVRQVANATTLYSEMQPRFLAAFAARNLWENSPKLQAKYPDMNMFANRMVNDSQLSWDGLSTARQLTPQGTAGQLSPLLNKFMGYQTRVTSLLTRELADAFGRSGPKQAETARKFLFGHAAAVTVLAGSLGLPMVGVAASVFDRLADWATGKDDWDVTAAYRNFLADTFGKQAGEVMARGAPRLAGVDFSHMGDEKLLPGSSAALMLTEKRKLEDAEKDWLKSEAGAPIGMLNNFILGARDVANGDFLKGAQKMVPETLRGPAEAAQLALYGYRGKGGTALPITANARDIALTAMGLDPQKEAEYNEAQKVSVGQKTLQQLREQNITQHLSLALNRGDQDNYNYWLGQSQQYGQDHPGMMPPAADLRRYMVQNARQAAIAQSMGLPIGIQPRDINRRGMVGFANFGQ